MTILKKIGMVINYIIWSPLILFLLLTTKVIPRIYIFLRTLISKLFHTSLPSYMNISKEDKRNLLDKIKTLIKDSTNGDYEKKEVQEITDILSKNKVKEDKIESISRYLLSCEPDRIYGGTVKDMLADYSDDLKEEIYHRVETYQYAITVGIYCKEKFLKLLEEYLKLNSISSLTKYTIDTSLLGLSVHYDDIIVKNKLSNIKKCDGIATREIKEKYHKLTKETILSYLTDKLTNDYQEIEKEYKNTKLAGCYEKKIEAIKEFIDNLKKIDQNNKELLDLEKKCNKLLKSND